MEVMRPIVTVTEITDDQDRKTGLYHMVEIRAGEFPLCSHQHPSILEALKCHDALAQVRVPL